MATEHCPHVADEDVLSWKAKPAGQQVSHLLSTLKRTGVDHAKTLDRRVVGEIRGHTLVTLATGSGHTHQLEFAVDDIQQWLEAQCSDQSIDHGHQPSSPATASQTLHGVELNHKLNPGSKGLQLLQDLTHIQAHSGQPSGLHSHPALSPRQGLGIEDDDAISERLCSAPRRVVGAAVTTRHDQTEHSMSLIDETGKGLGICPYRWLRGTRRSRALRQTPILL